MPMHAPASLRRNTVLTMTGAGVPILVSLFTIPPYLHLIGDARYGVLIMVWSIFGLFGLLDLGLGQATANQVAKIGPDAPEHRASVFWTACVISLGIGLLGGALLWIAGTQVVGALFSVPPELRVELMAALPWLAAAVPMVTMASVLQGFLEGLERFDSIIILDILGGVSTQLSPLVAAYVLGANLTWVLAAFVLTRLLTGILLAAIACAKAAPSVIHPRVRLADSSGLLSYGGWISVNRWMGPLQFFIDRAIINAIGGIQAVSHYNIPYNLVGRLSILPVSFSRVLFPRFSALDSHAAHGMQGEVLAVLAAIMTPVTVIGLVLLGPFLNVWLGPDMATIVTPIGQILLIGSWTSSFIHIPAALIAGQGRPDRMAKLNLILLGPYLLALWLATSAAGLLGAASVWVLRGLLGAAVSYAMAGYLREAAKLLLAPACLVFATLGTTMLLFQQASWRLGLGGPLILASLLWAWLALPTHLRKQAQRLLVTPVPSR